MDPIVEEVDAIVAVPDDDAPAHDICHELFGNPLVESESSRSRFPAARADFTGTATEAYERDRAAHEAYDGGARIVLNELGLSH